GTPSASDFAGTSATTFPFSNTLSMPSSFNKWDLYSAKIGRVTDDGMLRVLENGKVVAEVPAKSLAEGVPIIRREGKRPAYLDEPGIDPSQIKIPQDLNEILRKLLASSNIMSRAWIYEQFDQTVRTDTVVRPGSNAAVLRIKGRKQGIAFTTDCNSFYCYLDPFEGGKQVVAEACRNLVVSGAKPIALTDCLNFGNPENPEVFYQFEKCVDGICEAARFFDTPVISGNVSFYNESKGEAIYPTPVIGMIGILNDVEKHCTMSFKNEGDLVVLLGQNTDELEGSEYIKEIFDIRAGKPPKVNLDMEKKVQECCLKAIELGLVNSAHDVAEGGLAVALAECCIAGGFGFNGEINTQLRADAVLFGEGQSRIILSISEQNLSVLQKLANELGAPISVLGFVKKGNLKLNIKDNVEYTGEIDVPVDEISDIWRNAIRCKLER
ncbi:MAG TPA: phosphoribosylformylglycinamidine synthase II, partial [Thermoanaerobacterales bacterium]|nr:phosphoribosylformylglycinamidine synthase II [Thermoanaerobacterales bacterium]